MLYLYRQMRRDYKIKFTDKSKANLWIHLDLAKVHRFKGLASPYIISYLHFLNINNILTLPQTFVIAKLGLVWHELCSPCFLPARFTRMRTSLRNQNKCKPSISYCFNCLKFPLYIKTIKKRDTKRRHKDKIRTHT